MAAPEDIGWQEVCLKCPAPGAGQGFEAQGKTPPIHIKIISKTTEYSIKVISLHL
jgi:hypothetical protein